MRKDCYPTRTWVALVAAISLFSSPNMLFLAQTPQSPQKTSGGAAPTPTPVKAAATPTPAKATQTPTPAKAAPAAAGAKTTPQATATTQAVIPAKAVPAKAAAAPQTVNLAWPRNYKTPSGGRVTLYTPQVASWENQKHMKAYAAVSYMAPGATKAALGTVTVEADTQVSLQERLVNFAPLKITESHFSTLTKEQNSEIVSEISKSIPTEDRVIALDRVLAQVDTSQIIPKDVPGIKSDPPTIYFSKKPAVMVNIDGEPVWSPIKENDLKFAVNTNWDLFQYTQENTYYLRNNDAWLKASDVKGPWKPAGKLPKSFEKLPPEENFKDVKANVPGKKLKEDKAPTVFVNLQPAELILLEGEPKYVPVPGTQLLWVSNTESDLFRMGETGTVYYLVTGRWFSAPDFTGPWTFATTKLPEDFKKISLEHPRSRVLASVPGTRQAAEAVMLAQIPQTARVNKKQLKAPEVVYQGEPQFQAIEKTSVERAVNTDKDILKVGDSYYMCYQGVWFMAKSPKGPWEVTGSVPGQVYEIPASSPAHSVTYVTVKEESNSDWVEVAAVAGYTGMMIAWGCTVWGTGWYYPPYVWYGGYYPIYYPYWHTYGAAAWYNPHTGAYGVAGGIYGPYGGVTYGARYNPTTGVYARGASAYGPYGSRGYAQAYNPRTGAYAQTRQGSNVYGSWGSTYVQRGDDWAQTARYTDRQTGQTTRVTRGDEGAMISRRGPEGGGFVATKGDDVYAGKDGNVYKRDESGEWHKYENGSWNSVDTPERPSQSPSQQSSKTRDPMYREGAGPNQQPSAQTRDRAGQTGGAGGAGVQQPSVQSRDRMGQTGSSTGQLGSQGRSIDSSTFGQLERDHSSRASGAQRSQNYGNYRSSSSSSRSMGSYGGGGFRGGGRRR
jgi:hypothetical protein